jgi:hypothetical protein
MARQVTGFDHFAPPDNVGSNRIARCLGIIRTIELVPAPVRSHPEGEPLEIVDSHVPPVNALANKPYHGRGHAISSFIEHATRNR